MKNILSLLFIGLMSMSLNSLAKDSLHKKVLADFNENLLVIPCVKVEQSAFDGYYNVVMEVSGDGSGLNWEIVHVTAAVEGECELDESEDSPLDELLRSLGMPPLAELIDPSRYDDHDHHHDHDHDGQDDSDDNDDDQDQSDDSQDDSGNDENQDDDNSGTGESEGEIVIQ